MVTRTFSKAYGLASLRVGWAFCPESVADALNRVRGVFNVNGAAQAAAIAALNDTEHTRHVLKHNAKWLNWLETEINKLGLHITSSVANFLLVNFPEPDITKNAFEYLKTEGVIVRPVAAYGLSNCLRVSVGTEEDNCAFIESLSTFCKKIK